MSKFAGAEWVRRVHPDANMSTLGALVADVIGQITRGIYHVSQEIERVDWSNEGFIEWRTRASFATFDGSHLTELVVLAHDLCLRVEIRPMSNSTVAVCFSPRSSRRGAVHARHPALEDHVQQIREGLALPVEAAIARLERGDQ